MNEPITGSSEAPDGIDSLNSLAEYSNFSGGKHHCSYLAQRTAQITTIQTNWDLHVDVIDGLEQESVRLKEPIQLVLSFLRRFLLLSDLMKMLHCIKEAFGIFYTSRAGNLMIS